MASKTAEVAYVAAGYLRVEMSQGVYVYLLMSKPQVILLPKQTIPRIELLVSLILSKLITRVHSALLPLVKINEIFCWTDSTDSSLDKGGGQRIQAICWEQSQGNPSECAAWSVEPLFRKSESHRPALLWYGIRCI